jgi:hypothetical protein
MGRLPEKPIIWYDGFFYQAANWKSPQRVVVKWSGTRVTLCSSKKWMVGVAVKRTRVCRNRPKTMIWGGKKQS